MLCNCAKDSSKEIAVPASEGCLGVTLRNDNISWKGFLYWAGGRYDVCSRLSLITPFSYRNTLEYELRWLYASYAS
jgi:hypothetical protein